MTPRESANCLLLRLSQRQAIAKKCGRDLFAGELDRSELATELDKGVGNVFLALHSGGDLLKALEGVGATVLRAHAFVASAEEVDHASGDEAAAA